MDKQKKIDLLKKDRQYVWHPFTQMKDYEERDHLLIEKAEGVFLFDADGNKYYDSVSSWWTNIHGHNHPRIQKAIEQQIQKMDHVMFSGMTHEPGIELAEKLVEITPDSLTRVFYSDNGSTAVEVGLKMSFQYWQHRGRKNKHHFIYLNNSYHGDTLGAVSIGGVELFHSVFKPLLFPSFLAKSPADVGIQQSIEDVTAILEEHEDSIAGIVIEPLIQAAGGMHIYDPQYLKEIREVCDRYNVHLIVDEVATGFGRTGKMFACEHAGISPDIMCLSKGLTAGIMPLSTTLCKEEIYQAFYDDYDTFKTFFHGHSFTGNPLACAVAVESLRIFEEDQVMAHVETSAAYLQNIKEELISVPHVTNIRGIGMIAAWDLVQDVENGTPFDPEQRIGYHVYLESLKHGLVLRPLGDTLYLWLPLCTTTEQIADIMERTKAVIEKVTKSFMK
ncbi:adenosylmethionine--8-amino-7-oxononanoate transaminase [Longirhabdus pacifica]|uniref:adenosylmethionine--8-amino-7-oxononanoate transaminase n=1 Tax=Longirhabdus pacifica TaxID=2305227 RepID=UPI001008F6FF|nr:adenosylmethionine--8-amino-7-oxononanoate transaminase [Longirhabdus pacifica]